MFKKKRHVSEDFDVGKANMETPNYEIKINGQVPIDYATAINDRQKRVNKIEDDFVEKDNLTDEFIEEQDNRRMNESFNSNLYDESIFLTDKLNKFIDRINNLEDVDSYISDFDIQKLNDASTILDNFTTAYKSGGYPLKESSKAEQIKKEYKELEAKLKSEGKDIEKEKLNGPLHDLAIKYVDATIGIKESKEEACPKEVQELQEVEQPVKRRGRPKADPKDKMFSDGDLWLQVYDDLSSEVENEGKGKEVDKQVKIPRGKRFIGPYAGPGDYDLTVYGKNMEDLQWAKKVADHYGVDIEIKKDNNSNTNSYYPYVAILKDVK